MKRVHRVQPLTDRERILSLLVRELMSSQMLCPQGDSFKEASWQVSNGRTYAHFAYYREPVKGDLVIGSTGMRSEPGHWSIGWYHEAISESHAMIREIGSDRLCNYSNEKFIPIVGLHKSELLEGQQRVLNVQARQAMAQIGSYRYRFGGVDFHDGNIMEVWVREVFGGLSRDSESIPFSVHIPWTKRTTIKQIKAALVAGGVGTREFERKPLKESGSTVLVSMI